LGSCDHSNVIADHRNPLRVRAVKAHAGKQAERAGLQESRSDVCEMNGGNDDYEDLSAHETRGVVYLQIKCVLSANKTPWLNASPGHPVLEETGGYFI